MLPSTICARPPTISHDIYRCSTRRPRHNFNHPSSPDASAHNYLARSRHISDGRAVLNAVAPLAQENVGAVGYIARTSTYPQLYFRPLLDDMQTHLEETIRVRYRPLPACGKSFIYPPPEAETYISMAQYNAYAGL